MSAIPLSQEPLASAAQHRRRAVLSIGDVAQAREIAGWLAEYGMEVQINDGGGRAHDALAGASLLVVDRLIADRGPGRPLCGLQAHSPGLRIIAIGERLSRDAAELGRMRDHGPAIDRVLPGRPDRDALLRTLDDLL